MLQFSRTVSGCHGIKLKNHIYSVNTWGRKGAFFGYARSTQLRSDRAPAQALKFDHLHCLILRVVLGTALAPAN